MPNLPEARFDESLAVRCFPRPVVKWAVLVPIPEEFPTFIRPEWDDTGLNPQVFFGDYYLILDGRGRGRYGSAADQWRNMHRSLPLERSFGDRIPAMGWVKVLVPEGHEVAFDCELVTLIPTESGEIRESRKAITAGTLVLRQPGGEFQFVRNEDRAAIYYSAAEAEELGLNAMSADEFAEWALGVAVRELVPVG